MEIKTFRAKTMQQALALVRRELGPDATVLHTRELNSSLVGRLVFGRQYEVAASAAVNVPSRLPPALRESARPYEEAEPPVHLEVDYRARYRDDFRHEVAGQLDELQAMVEKLCQRTASTPHHDLPESLFRVFTDMIEAEVDETTARSLIDRVRSGKSPRELADAMMVRARVAQLLEDELRVTGPISTDPSRGAGGADGRGQDDDDRQTCCQLPAA
jgi:flagellar biosynthesis protein FlhF